MDEQAPPFDLSDEEREALRQAGLDYPTAEEKQNMFAIFKFIINQKDNTKTSCLTEPEIGLARFPVRTNLQIAHYCNKMGMSGVGKFFNDEAQILNATSLGRKGFLINQIVTQKKETTTSMSRGTFSDRGKGGLFTKKKSF